MTTTIGSCSHNGVCGHLPEYTVFDYLNNQRPQILKVPSQELTFPLSPEDLNDVKILEAKFDHETNCAGLAAPQIGIAKQIIVFAAPENPDLKKWRSDFTQTMDKTIWINPTYEGIGEDKHEDYEGCFSVLAMAGPVKRFQKIKYQAYTITGEPIEGTAEGYLARVIQHEVDHIHGTLFVDHVPEGYLLKIEEYRRKRAEAIQAGTPTES
jgi:peptide deformylase